MSVSARVPVVDGTPPRLEVRDAAGSVTVEAVEGADRVEAWVEPLDEAAEQVLDRVEIEAREGAAGSPARLRVSVPERRLLRTPAFAVHISTPPGAAARIAVASADVRVTGRLGELEVTGASADLDVESGTDVHLRTASGDCRIGTVERRGSIGSASGDVRVGRATGPVKLRTASGDVEVEQTSDDVSISTASGDVTIGAATGGVVQAKTASGDVTVGVARGCGSGWTSAASPAGWTPSCPTTARTGTARPRWPSRCAPCRATCASTGPPCRCPESGAERQRPRRRTGQVPREVAPTRDVDVVQFEPVGEQAQLVAECGGDERTVDAVFAMRGLDP